MHPAEFAGKDIISIRDFGRKELELIFDYTDALEREPRSAPNSMTGELVGLLFFEPSTRTYSSFSIAAQRLGCSVTGFANPTESSVTKGETLYDTVKMFEGYGARCLIIRHGMMGATRFASETTDVPVINAGDGSREHPTQAMLDLYSIRKSLGKIDGLKVGILGDLKYGRTASSLSYALANYDVEVAFIAPEALQIRPEVGLYMKERNVRFTVGSDLRESIRDLDVLYVTRIQKERIPDPTEYEKLRGQYKVDLELLKGAKDTLKVMHPLPRVDEIPNEVDGSKFAGYFVQAASGLPLRMAVIKLVVKGQ
ncbi:MAG: aspartate carbamoyltransferase [Nitrososphaerales archaeon]|nr:aspartate carbamoyltransferase [Nitrososphaerales archaeon]